jgi:hypothetical protein
MAQLWSDKELGDPPAAAKKSIIAPGGKRIVALMPAAEFKGSQEAQNHVVFLLDFPRRAAAAPLCN